MGNSDLRDKKSLNYRFILKWDLNSWAELLYL
jgi:hypothetical protein